jgi:hypothetical protein
MIKEEKAFSIAPLSGPTFTLLATYEASDPLCSHTHYHAFGAKAWLSQLQDVYSLQIDATLVTARVVLRVKTELGIVIKPKSNIILGLSEQTYQQLKAAEQAFDAPYQSRREAAKAARQASIASMPRRYALAFGVVWEEGRITTVREVVMVHGVIPQDWKSHQQPEKVFFIDQTLRELNGQLGERSSALIKEIQQRQAFGKLNSREVTLFPLSQPEAENLLQVYEEENVLFQQLAERKEIARLQTLAQAAAEAAKIALASQRVIEQNELLIVDVEQTCSLASQAMMHSLGATFSAKDNRIEIYTTRYAKEVERATGMANTTYSLRKQLDELGYQWHPAQKKWLIEYNTVTMDKTIVFLRKYDSKAWPDTVKVAAEEAYLS